MKIGSLDTKPVGPAGAPERKDAALPAGTKSAASVEPSAHVALSPSALGKVAADPTFDVEKVERIAAAIRSGQYRINAEAIADKLIVNAEELLGRKLG